MQRFQSRPKLFFPLFESRHHPRQMIHTQNNSREKEWSAGEPDEAIESFNDKRVFLFLFKHTLSPSVHDHVIVLQNECLNDPDQAPMILNEPLKWFRESIENLYGASSTDPTQDNFDFLKRRLNKDDTAQTYITAKTAAYKKFLRSSFPDVKNEAGYPLLLSALIDGLPKDIAVRVESSTINDFGKELPRLLKIYKPVIVKRKQTKKPRTRAARPRCTFLWLHGPPGEGLPEESCRAGEPSCLSPARYFCLFSYFAEHGVRLPEHCRSLRVV